jgi:hypothetical protein|uniref:Uncharacterized protein n=1 Tax=Zea mays TaxID=4577 RepID=A0A804UE10_MAIZE
MNERTTTTNNMPSPWCSTHHRPLRAATVSTESHVRIACIWFVEDTSPAASDGTRALAPAVHLRRFAADDDASAVAHEVDDVEAVEYGDHDHGGQEGEERAEDPEQEGHPGVEEPVADEVEGEAALQDVADVVPGGRQREAEDGGVGVGGGGEEAGRGVDEEAGLVEEADGEGVAEEGEEEEQHERHVLERHHVLAVRAEHGVAERLLDGVGAAQHRRHARAEEDRRRGHQRRPHDDVPHRLHHRHRVLGVVLRLQLTITYAPQQHHAAN